MKLFFSLFLLSLLTGFSVKAQGVDTTYYRTFPRSFQIKGALQYEPTLLQLRQDGSDEQLLYRGNIAPKAGFGANPADIHFIIAFKLPNSFARDEDKYGDTDDHDFRLNINEKKFVLSFDYLFRKGFYLAGTKELPDVPENDVPFMPGLAIESYSLNFAYVFNSDRFSYRLPITQMDKQEKSAGSFLLMANAKHFSMWSNNGLVPSVYEQYFDNPLRLSKGNFSSFALMPGYSHTFVAGDFYLNLGAAYGPDLQYKSFRVEASEEKQDGWQVKPRLTLRGGLGYDNGEFFSGLYYLRRQSRYTAGSLDIIEEPAFVRFVVGHRFPEPAWMRGIREWGVYRWAKNLF